MVHLDSVAFHLTYVCGNKCSYCYVGEANRASHPTHAQVQKVIKKILSSDVKEILLVGGDVCLYPKLKEVVSQIKRVGVKCSVLSNTLDFRKDAEFFVKNLDSIEATVLGSTAKKHDAETRTSGSFELLVNNIRKINALVVTKG